MRKLKAYSHRKSMIQALNTLSCARLESLQCTFVCGWLKHYRISQKTLLVIHTFQVVNGSHSTSLGSSWWDCAALICKSSSTLQSFILQNLRTCLVIPLPRFYAYWRKKKKTLPMEKVFSCFYWSVNPLFHAHLPPSQKPLIETATAACIVSLAFKKTP